MNEPWHTCAFHDQQARTPANVAHIFECVMAHGCTVTRTNKSCHTSEWVMSHIWMRRVADMNESCHMCEWVMAHVRMSHVMHKSWRHSKICENAPKNEYAISHMWMSHGTHMNESWHTYEWVIAHIWMSHGTHTDGSCHNESCHILMRHANMNVSCLIWMTHVTYTCHVSYERLMSRINESCHVLMSHVNVDVSHVNESCQYEWVMSHMDDLCHVYMSCLIWMSHVTY